MKAECSCNSSRKSTRGFPKAVGCASVASLELHLKPIERQDPRNESHPANPGTTTVRLFICVPATVKWTDSLTHWCVALDHPQIAYLNLL